MESAYIVSSEDAVEELQGANDNKERQESINQLSALRCLLAVEVIDILKDLIPIGGARAAAGSRLLRRGRRSGSRCGRLRRGSGRRC